MTDEWIIKFVHVVHSAVITLNSKNYQVKSSQLIFIEQNSKLARYVLVLQYKICTKSVHTRYM